MITAKNIHKFYGNQHILKGINLDVKGGNRELSWLICGKLLYYKSWGL